MCRRHKRPVRDPLNRDLFADTEYEAAPAELTTEEPDDIHQLDLLKGDKP